MHCWYPDTSTDANADNTGFKIRQAYIIKKPNPKGTFSLVARLENMFGFCEDYNKVMYGLRHTLTLTRSTDDHDAIFRANGVAAAKVKLTKISWMMPKILPSDEKKYKLYNNKIVNMFRYFGLIYKYKNLYTEVIEFGLSN